MQKAKQYYEKMVDFKQYALVMLAASSFFYLGAVIPSIEKTQNDITIMMMATIVLLAGSIIFFTRSKIYRHKLLEMEEGQQYLMKK